MMQSRARQALVGVVAVFALGGGVANGQITSNATCDPSFSYLYNSKGQSPCLVAAYLGGACNGGQYDVSALLAGQHYIGPSTALVDPCQCSTVMYSMMGACSTCQNATVITWTAWDATCNNIYVDVFPTNIPVDTRVPAWAYQNVTATNVFDPQVALSNNAPESTATNIQTTRTGGSGPTQTNDPSSSGGKKSNTGAIVGGVVGGIIVLALIALAAFFLLRRNKRRAAARRNAMGVSDGDPNASPLMMGHKDGLYTPSNAGTAPYGSQSFSPPPGVVSPYPHHDTFVGQKPYNPDDPSTFPASPPPATLNSQYSGPQTTFGGSHNLSYTAMPTPPISTQGGYRGAPEV